ncbi:MAG: glycosyltransferase [Chitinophagales bacterium]
MKVSIIIRAFNEEKHIGKLLKGISEQTETSIETILVDSGSTDKTVKIASHYNVKLVTIKPEDFSFGYSLNKGCEAASGEFLIMASAHVYPVYKDWISQMLLPFENNEIALVYGKQRGNELTKYSEHKIFEKWFPEESDFDQQTPFCNNANSAIRKSLWENDRYNETVTGLEDLEWATRIMEKGYKIAYNADAEIIHVHEETPQSIMNRYYREALALKKIMPDHKFSFLDFVKLTSSNIVSDFAHAFQEKKLIKNLFTIPEFRVMQFWGTYKGHNLKANDGTLRKRFYYPNPINNKNTAKDLERTKIDY